MQESKIEATERLRREGLWGEASKFKDAVIKQLRAEGKKRGEAAEEAWVKMAEKFPPLPPAPLEPGLEEQEAEEEPIAEARMGLCDEVCRTLMDDVLGPGAASEIEEWAKKFGIELSEGARLALQIEFVRCWCLGFVRRFPDGEPLTPSSCANKEQFVDKLCDHTSPIVKEWADEHGLVLSEEAQAHLIARHLMWFWTMGFMRDFLKPRAEVAKSQQKHARFRGRNRKNLVINAV
jgi:hypothetical protein